MDVDRRPLGEWQKGPKVRTVLSDVTYEGFDVIELRDVVEHTDRENGKVTQVPSHGYMLPPDAGVLRSLGEALIALANEREAAA